MKIARNAIGPTTWGFLRSGSTNKAASAKSIAPEAAIPACQADRLSTVVPYFYCLNMSRDTITRITSFVPSSIWCTRKSRTMRSTP
jgi:hypothetical protein